MKRLAPVLLALSLVCVSCSLNRAPLLVLRGNILFNRGEDALAGFSYLRALQLREAAYQPWIAYDLGSAYVSLGELQPGIRRLRAGWEALPEGGGQRGRRQRELAFRIHFNIGVAEFERGDYGQAAASFIRALRLRPESWDTKVNLELSLAESSSKARILPKTRPAVQDQGSIEQSLRILDNIQRKEEPAWTSAPVTKEAGPDW